MKIYDTGDHKWTHGRGIQHINGLPTNHLLGPCPVCGKSTVTYGGGWNCDNCSISSITMPEWWNTDINVYKDGDSWCATRDNFTCLQECPAGFGDTPSKAVKALYIDEQKENSK